MTKRALILAGGGVKVAFQAGVLQVWLDEAELRFDHADGASGGTFRGAQKLPRKLRKLRGRIGARERGPT
jgi:predicted patatin/cPLA2 family phospholipase